MFQVPQGQIAAVGSASDYAVPTAVDLTCPACKMHVTFALPAWGGQQVRGLPISARCPRCGEGVTFLRLGGRTRDDMRIYVDAESPERPSLRGLDEVPHDRFSPRLKKAYQAALKAHANDDPQATAVHCRRVLEGITVALLAGDETQPKLLARRLETLAKHHQEMLAQPLLDLSQSLKEGGNLGAHFDDESDTSIEDAAHMLELLENLITYLFVLPERITRFRSEVLGEQGRAYPLGNGDTRAAQEGLPGG